MNKTIAVILLTLAGVTSSSAAQQPVTNITSGTGTTGLSLKQYNDTYINPRLTNIQANDTDLYTNKADKSSFSSSSAFAAAWGWTPGGGVTSYNELTNKPIAGTDYLAPNGSAANLTNFPPSLATDAEVTAAVANKADAIIGTSGQVPVFNSSNVLQATSVPDLTVAEVVGLFTGDGDYLKADGTKGTPTGGSSTTMPTKIAYDPTSSTAEGVYISTATNHQFAVYADGGVFDVTAGTYTAPPSDPCADGLLTNGCFDTDGSGWTVSGAPTFTGGKATLDYGDSISQTFTASTSGTTFFRAHLKFDALDNENSVFPIQLKSGATVVASFEVRSTNILRINGGDLYVQAASLAPATDYYIWGSITTGTGSATITARVGTTNVYDAAAAYTAVTTATIDSMPTSIVAQAVTYDTGGMIYVDSLAVSETLIGDFNE